MVLLLVVRSLPFLVGRIEAAVTANAIFDFLLGMSAVVEFLRVVLAGESNLRRRLVAGIDSVRTMCITQSCGRPCGAHGRVKSCSLCGWAVWSTRSCETLKTVLVGCVDRTS
ncbi:hypothetical protein GOBAR_AA23926 [Gossypium barbadense]|uniref:Secreted protein n=1 Tax=Gossypium barbadense TaxID=3634 RepID=A0A2P5X082_GOSBA|nr:hypothetical protein GOBAR_AA23926 [Gossypium barbadense]